MSIPQYTCYKNVVSEIQTVKVINYFHNSLMVLENGSKFMILDNAIAELMLIYNN